MLICIKYYLYVVQKMYGKQNCIILTGGVGMLHIDVVGWGGSRSNAWHCSRQRMHEWRRGPTLSWNNNSSNGSLHVHRWRVPRAHGTTPEQLRQRRRRSGPAIQRSARETIGALMMVEKLGGKMMMSCLSPQYRLYRTTEDCRRWRRKQTWMHQS